MFTELWEDELGFVDVGTYLILVTMIVLSCVVGFSALRTNLVQEFGDLAVSLERLDQSYSYTMNGVTSTYADTDSLSLNTAGTPPAGLDVVVAPSSE